MRIVEQMPHRVREIENLWIPLPDGCRLAARAWLPEGAEQAPVPAVVEYLPYRKRDRTRDRDEPIHRYFAGHGYAALRVDVRGTGESDGVLADEYSEAELADGEALIAWLAAQPWCSGAVGVLGKSWGGFNALQLAARRPPALGAVISVCASDDRYADDAHYMGGCLLNENLVWGSALFTLAALPPDPELVGEGWREAWHRRLEALPLYAETWMRHPRRDAYWRRGSVSDDLGAIRCPVLAVGGWADAYTNAVPRLVAGLDVPRRGLVGPWAHVYPHEGVPGPAVGFLQEAVGWWDRWLKGIDNGADRGPMLRAWMQESVPPLPRPAERPGRWVAEQRWPSPRIERRRLRLVAVDTEGEAGAPAGALETVADGGEGGDSERRLDHRSPQSVGLAGGAWCPFDVDDLPDDQRADDRRSLVFDTAPLAGRLEILGAPEVTLDLVVDRPAAQLAARLCDVGPDGSSARVTYGVLDLAHRDGHRRPEPPEPGRRYRVRLRLNDVAHAFAAGHRVRLALSTAYWPQVWPAAEPASVGVFTGGGAGSALELPVRPPDPADARLPPPPPAEAAPADETEELDEGSAEQSVRRDRSGGETTLVADFGALADGRPALTRLAAIGLDHGHAFSGRLTIDDDDPLSARSELVHRVALERDGWSVEVDTRTRLEADRESFHLSAEIEAREGGRPVFTRRWDRRIPRTPTG